MTTSEKRKTIKIHRTEDIEESIRSVINGARTINEHRGVIRPWIIRTKKSEWDEKKVSLSMVVELPAGRLRFIDD